MRSCHQSKSIWALALLVSLLSLLIAACGASNVPQEVTVTAKFAGGQLTPDTVQASQGDNVTLSIESDRDGAFHIHGYDLEREVTAGAVADFQFVANATGRFLVNFHGAAAPEDSPSEMDGAMNHGAMHEGSPAAMDGTMDHHAASHAPVESPVPVSLAVDAWVDDKAGVLVQAMTEGWRWAPEEVNLADSPGAGHAHIYAAGVKLGRVYGSYYYLPDLAPGSHELEVVLNSNGHSQINWQGEPVRDTVVVNVPAREDVDDNQPLPKVAAESPMSVAIAVNPDALGGYNLQVTPTGFSFTEGVDPGHVPAQGYGLVSINGKAVTRLYGPWLNLPAQGPGTHTFTVALLSNQGRLYQHNGQPATASVQVEEAVAEQEASAAQADHHGSGSAAGHGGDHHSQTGAAATVELELGYLEVLPR